MAAAQQVAGRGAEVKFVQADANYPDQARRAGDEATVHLGGIDVLVNRPLDCSNLSFSTIFRQTVFLIS